MQVMTTQSRIRVEYVFDNEVGTWHFRVPALHIVGGGEVRKEDARLRAREAIAFTLEELGDLNKGADSEYLEVTVG